MNIKDRLEAGILFIDKKEKDQVTLIITKLADIPKLFFILDIKPLNTPACCGASEKIFKLSSL
jgi:hypothetical protein